MTANSGFSIGEKVGRKVVDMINGKADTSASTLLSLLKELREINEKPVSYTQGQHDAISMLMLVLLTLSVESAKRIKSLEARGAGVKYRGVYSEHDQYGPGDFCTHDGSLWHANALTCARPGQSRDWTLAVKRGRDGKDGRK